MPGKSGLNLTSSDEIKAGNLDCFGFFGHALEDRSHWRPDDPGPGEEGDPGPGDASDEADDDGSAEAA